MVLFRFLNLRYVNLRLRINNLIWEVINGGSFGLIVTVLLGIESSAAFVMASVMSFTFWSIFVCESIFSIIFEFIRSCQYLS